MTRTAPDPVFAAAALEEVQQRLRDHRRTAPAPGRARRPWIVELSAVAGVAALAAGAVFAVHTLQPSPDRDGAPVGSISRTAEPTPAVTPSVTPSDTPSPSAPVPTAPVTTPPPTAPTAPPSSPSTPTTTTTTAPPVAGSSTLVGPAGAVLRTDAQIRAYAQGRGFSDIWAQQGILDRDCMAAQGFLYDPEAGLSDTGGMSSADRAAFSSALLGPPTSEPYDWRTAGCHGASVHETGQDGKD